MSERWASRPVLSFALRAFVFLIPIPVSMLAAATAGLYTSRLLPIPSGIASTVLWWIVFLIPSAIAFVLATALARRLLPLAALLKLSLLFPENAPSRFRVGMKAAARKRLGLATPDGESQEQPAGDPGETALALAFSISKDQRLQGHSDRVAKLVDLVSQEVNLPDDGRERLRWAAILHDAGKLPIVTGKVTRPDGVKEENWEPVRRHPVEGLRMVEGLLPWLGIWAGAILQHHERPDGLGYPFGVSGNEISLGARIIAVADAYDEMVSPAPNHKALSMKAARERLVGGAGTEFDSAVVRAFLNLNMRRLWRSAGLMSWVESLPFISRAAANAMQFGFQTSIAAAAASSVAVAVIGLGSVVPPLNEASASPPSPPRAAVLGSKITSTSPIVEVVADPPAIPAPQPKKAPPKKGQNEDSGGHSDTQAPAQPDDPAVEYRNHGECVSQVASDHQGDPTGSNHGERVSSVARTDCGK